MTTGTGRADVVVIGAGMAGVSAARALASGGADVVVVESADRVGGRVRTVRDLVDHPVEAGAELIHGDRAATWGDVRAAGLRTVPTPYLWTWMHLRGTTRWLPRQMLHPGVWPAFDVLWRLGRVDRDVSGAEFLAERGYRGTARDLAAMTVAGHLPGSVEEIGVAGLLADGVLDLESGRNHRVVSGYDLLPAHIATGLDVRYGFRVRRIAWGPEGVEVTSADGETIESRVAITTLPHGVLTRGDVSFEPALPEAKRSALERIASGPVCKVLLAFEDRFWPARATQVACVDGPVMLYWPIDYGVEAPPVLSAYATGPRARALSEAGAERALEIVLDDLRRVFPGSRPAATLRAWRFVDWYTDPHALGGYTFLRPGGVGARADLAAPTGALLWAGSATQSSPVAATVEAAYLSGLRAAREASELLRTG